MNTFRFLILLSLVCLMVPARAEHAHQIDVSPLVHELKAARNGMVEETFTVLNVTDRPVHIIVEANDWFVQPHNNGITVDQWLSIEPKELNLAAREASTVRCVARVPRRAAGELAAKVSFTPRDEQGGMLVVKVSGSLYVTITGTERVGATISDIVIRTHKDGYQCAVTLKNTGNVHLRPRGSVVIAQDGTQVRSVELKHGWPVYPNAEVAYFGIIENMTLQAGRYHMTADMDLVATDTHVKKSRLFTVDHDGTLTMR